MSEDAAPLVDEREDSAVSTEAPLAAGIPTIFFPGAYHRDEAAEGVRDTVDRLTPALFGL